MKHVLFLFYLFILTVLLSCDPKETDSCHRRIKFQNNSNKDVYIAEGYYYPDTTIRIYKASIIEQPDIYKVEKGNYNDLALKSRSCFEIIFDPDRGSIPSGIIMVFVFDAHVLETTPWDTVRAKYMVLKRYDLTLQDLQDLNWTINYP